MTHYFTPEVTQFCKTCVTQGMSTVVEIIHCYLTLVYEYKCEETPGHLKLEVKFCGATKTMKFISRKI